MSKITIVRTGAPMLPDADLSGVRQFLFELFRGLNETDNKGWKRLWKRFVDLDAGEIYLVEFVIPRNGKFHRKFFALLDIGYDCWEPCRVRKNYKGRAVEKCRDQFREEITILAGYYEQTFNLKGEMKLRAKSISFAKMDDVEFERLYQSVVTVLLREVCHNYKNRAELDSVVDQVLRFA